MGSDALTESLFNLQLIIKVVILAGTYPFWGRYAKAMWRELQESMAPEGGVYGNQDARPHDRPPGLDPFWSIPLRGSGQSQQEVPEVSKEELPAAPRRGGTPGGTRQPATRPAQRRQTPSLVRDAGRRRGR